MPTSISREGLTIDDVGRLIRRTVLNPYLTLPLAAAIVYFEKHPDHYRDFHLQELHELLGIDLSLLSRIGTYLTGFGIAGATLAANDQLTHLFANNFTSPAHGEWTDWSKEIVLVTGGSSGIGQNVIQGLLERNPRTTVVIVDYAPLSWTVPENAQKSIHYYQADLTKSDVIRSVAARVKKEVGHPTVLINNAGIARGFTIMEGSYGDVESTLRTNLTAPFLLTKEFLPEMVRRNHGHIVNICSMSAFLPPPYIGDYAASKAGVQMLHESLQLELKHAHKAKRVRLTLAIPSFIQTPLIGASHPRQNNFIFPLLHVRTVSEEIVDSLYSGYGRTIYLPGIMRYLTSLRGAPEWVLRMARESTVKIPVDFKGRQVVDVETGGIKLEDHEA
ncbi:hypothetical protein SMACR_06358 [Sordaria macrospora]|uniref:Uncharacterized protein n=1 Tax=Sordaria macrospora TaxID=5147 RepID=A0A8S8ZH56_SORMA|nr:hypothetical protein SMACR_06358 [Sordaria macrospora]KAH7628222.1 hypothetical protein B0T09DRAFT_177355 [Sordaria sp. MPI-SDFR-AT-0083]WPJ65676.1 hypothetical protein SMAC4_06358 [Sordaria macrospora]